MSALKKYYDPIVEFFKPLIDQVKIIADAWLDSKAGTYGASVAYYTIFSLAPIIVIVISIMSFFITRTDAVAGIIGEFTKIFGSSGANFIISLVDANISGSTTVITTIVGIIILLIGALKIFTELQSALDTIFESLPEKKVLGFAESVKKYFFSIGMVLSLGFVMLVSLILSTLITAVSTEITTNLPGVEIIAQLVEFIISLGLISLFLAIMYKWLPTHRLEWKPAIAGGLIAGILFTISKYLLGLYLGSSTVLSTFGAASALVLVIIWAYYMAQVFFFAALLTKIYIVPKLKQ